MIHEFDFYEKRFRDYVNSLDNNDPFVQEHLDLKVEHTFRVVRNITEIAGNLGLDKSRIETARLIALVHDIGRFEQFIKYKTFDDSLSVNHAELGVHILMNTGFLNEPDESEWALIKGAVMNHNTARLNPGLDKQVMHFARLIRDADKVDIWYILTQRNVINKILEDRPEEESYDVPEHILESFRKGIGVEYAESINDIRLLRLSWIYDMNFPATFELVLTRGYITAILAKIPPSREKEEIAGIIFDYARERAAAYSKP